MEKFKELVIRAHGDQKYGDHPYSYHLEAVLKVVQEFTSDHAVHAAAFAHDLFEDTSIGIDDYMEHFQDTLDPWDLAVSKKLIDRLTDRPGKNRLERHLNTYWRIREAPDAVLIKLADRFVNHTNATNLKSMYAREYIGFKFALYRPEQYDELWKRLDVQVEHF